mmetsp:Transcript_48011/g.135643  ORF Transcript_48011/g.135643 Transcript_48011/m.135643 type:complete len:670 (-) Transcript_48011:25-2034(-)
MGSCCCSSRREISEGVTLAGVTRVTDIRPEGAGMESRPSRIVMNRYRMFMSDEHNMGEGTSSVCRKGLGLETQEPVAIKAYKARRARRNCEGVTLTKFRRQVAVLQELKRPFVEPTEPHLWNEQLRKLEPSQLFVQLVDYSRDSSGLPGPDPEDGTMYVVTELAQYSLKDYIKLRRQEAKPLSKESVNSITKSVVTVAAGLHAKGLVHLDLKPENLMFFDGCLKLIDVDGCLKVGTDVSATDSSLSFSPCYCAPEWAGFLIEEDRPTITISPALDVWSIGMTVCELVVLDAVLKPTYVNFMRHGRSHREAAFHFMDWLSSLKAAPMPQFVGTFDEGLLRFLSECLLVCDPARRSSLASSMGHAYIARARLGRSRSIPLTFSVGEDEHEEEGLLRELPRHRKHRPEDDSEQCLHKGLLWKLNSGGNPKDPAHWLQRDMWISGNGSLCYFSKREGRRLVLVDADHVSTADLARLECSAKDPAFTLRTRLDRDELEGGYTFACDSLADYVAWVDAIERVKADVMRTMTLGPVVAQDLHNFKLAVKNRRMKVSHGSKDQYDPVFKASLWKARANGDRMQQGDWFEREMWIAKNGSLVYWSKKEERELVYYTHTDVARARLSAVPPGRSCRPWAFEVLLAGVDGMEFTPGCFAAQSEGDRDRWISEFQKCAAES